VGTWGIADSPQEALSGLFALAGSRYSDPDFSWKHVLAPAAIGFVRGRALGWQFSGDVFVGFSVPEPLGGPLFHFNLTGTAGTSPSTIHGWRTGSPTISRSTT
jgi:aldose sugar dehydrogenase